MGGLNYESRSTRPAATAKVFENHFPRARIKEGGEGQDGSLLDKDLVQGIFRATYG